jgi:hypothetical protein
MLSASNAHAGQGVAQRPVRKALHSCIIAETIFMLCHNLSCRFSYKNLLACLIDISFLLT